MLDDSEWAQIEPLMHRTIGDARRARRATEADGSAARARFHEITGYDESHVGSIWHHKLSLYGPPCARCGRLLRTPAAHFCSNCGAAAKRDAAAQQRVAAEQAPPDRDERQ